jgi:hypothetical protein
VNRDVAHWDSLVFDVTLLPNPKEKDTNNKINDI